MNETMRRGYLYLIQRYSLNVCELYLQSKALESFSNRLMPLLDYDMDDKGEVSVRNDSRDFYRAIDYTPIVEYFQQVIVQTIRTEWKSELDYLKAYDKMRVAMRNIVDMPGKKANQFILFVRQNGGRLSQRKRQLFPELRDDEITRLEAAIAEAGGVAETGDAMCVGCFAGGER
ncbi:MAG: hypothetical protein IJG84_18425 [Kiritimatiellae bacterium]|nr:hypothetical protein [Kiritimatiellia bacterium]